MASENSICEKYNLRPRRSRRKIQVIHKPSLLEEIMFNILLRLPAELLHNVIRKVCREWRNIVENPMFIDAHLQSSQCGLLMWTRNSSIGKHVDILENGDVDVCNTQLMDNCVPLSSCNGLVLFGESKASRMHVVNLFTRECITIPIKGRLNSRSRLGYASCSRQYKVVYRYVSKMKYRFRIFTLGLDKEWRCLSSEHQLSVAMKSFHTYMEPHSIGGFIYWYDYYKEYDPPCVLSLDLQTERFQLSAVPCPEGYHGKMQKALCAIGTSVSFIAVVEDYLWEVWVLSGSEKRAWNKLFTVDLVGHKRFLDILIHHYYHISLLMYSENRELVLFSAFSNSSKYLIVYDIKMEKIYAREGTGCFIALPYAKSLVTIKGKKSTSTISENENILNSRIDALEKELSTTKKALNDALLREERLQAYITEKKKIQ